MARKTAKVPAPPDIVDGLVARLPLVKVGGKHKLTCPECGAHGLDNFLYLEDVQNYRELISLKQGLLLIRSFYKVFDEGGNNPHLGCKACDADLAIPEALDLDWE
jgi:hypothetical protein